MHLNKIRIVIVDDNIDFMDILREYLSKKDGFEIVGTAANGLEAMEIIMAIEPDVVLMDIVMPHLDGLGVLEKLSSLHMSKKPQFIMLSALGLYKTMQIALTLGAEFFMMKPFDLEDLVSRIRQLQSFQNQDEIHPVDPNNFKLTQVAITEISIESQIKIILDHIGVPSHLKGYHYLVYAITMVVEDLTAINSMTKFIYLSTAHEFKTSQTRVERAIRNAIEITWSRGDLDSIFTLFKYDMNVEKIRPSNSEFIMMVANKIWNKSTVV